MRSRIPKFYLDQCADLKRKDVFTDDDFELVRQARKFCQFLKDFNKKKYIQRTPVILCRGDFAE